MKTAEEVQAFMAGELHNFLIPIEGYRVKKVRTIKQLLFLGALSAIFLLISIMFVKEWPIVISLFALLFSLGYAYETLEKMKIALQRDFKSEILPRLLKFLFNQYDYIPNQKIAKSILAQSQLISDEITRVEGEDFMRFRLGETGIMFCETIVYRLNKSDGPVFEGVFLVASFNKTFKSQTVVLPQHNISLINKLLGRETFDIFQKVHLEDVAFSKEFAVYSTDQVDSRYILTTSLMSRILGYKQKVNRKISISFVDDKMFCAIPNYINLFEPAIFESFFNFRYLEKSYEALSHYTGIVEDLNLNLKIWSKM
jgi:hypothetical protein